jgi:oligoribonuclease NrnB/cAMP/cGMP phosphodiesterase (DHH superfamily)
MEIEPSMTMNTSNQKQKVSVDVDFSKLEIQPEEVNMVLYHKNCSDGFGSAFSAWKLLGERATYHPVLHDKKGLPDVTGKNVVMCDIAFDTKTTIELISKARRFAVLDHHITARKDLEPIDNKYKVFRMDHSGAYLAWRFFNRSTFTPSVILFIQDRDLWTNKMPYHEEFIAYFYNMVKFDFKEYDKYLDTKVVNKAIEDGKVLVPFMNMQMDNIIKHSTIKLMRWKEQYFLVACLNSNIYKSELGNKLLFKYPEADFSVVYNYDDGQNETYFSLRSADDREDSEVIAKSCGGGGHRNASGTKSLGLNCVLPFLHYDIANMYDLISQSKVEQVSFFDPLHNVRVSFSVVMLNTPYHGERLVKYLSDKRKADVTMVWYREPQQYVTIIINKNAVLKIREELNGSRWSHNSTLVRTLEAPFVFHNIFRL